MKCVYGCVRLYAKRNMIGLHVCVGSFQFSFGWKLNELNYSEIISNALFCGRTGGMAKRMRKNVFRVKANFISFFLFFICNNETVCT